MEDVADALKMAGSVVLFVIALATAIRAFSQARVMVDEVLKYSDREYLTVERDQRFYYVADKENTGEVARNVGLDTVIPSLFRVYNENYKIAFEFEDNYYLYIDNEGNKITSLEALQGGVTTRTDKTEFIKGILYGPADERKFKKYFLIKELNDEPLFKHLEGKKIVEYLGIYDYQDVGRPDKGSERPEDTSRPSDARIDPANRKTRRVITYKVTN